MLARFTALPASSPADHDLAAALYRDVRRSGHAVRSLVDCLIGAVALRLDVPVLARDRDVELLAAVSSLRLVGAGQRAPGRTVLSYPAARLALWSWSREEGERLSYEDMARSHVKELVREAFELDEVVVDSDGDLPFPCGTAMFYLSVSRHGRVLKAWSRAVAGIRVNKPVLREINEVNAGLTFARVWANESEIWVEGRLPLETLRVRDVGALCVEVGSTSDKLGSMLAAVYGGRVAFPDAAEHGPHHECGE